MDTVLLGTATFPAGSKLFLQTYVDRKTASVLDPQDPTPATLYRIAPQ